MTTAFLAVVLGPVLLGALSVAGTVATASRHQAEHRLNLAADAVRTSIGALCQQLHATAGALAVLADPASRTGAAGEVVTRGLATAVLVTDRAGGVAFVTPAAPARPWASCSGPAGSGPAPRALAAGVELRNRAGTLTGVVWAAQVLDAAFVQRLAAAGGTAVTLLRDDPGPPTALPDPAPSSAGTAPSGPGAAPSGVGTAPSGPGAAPSGVDAVPSGAGPTPPAPDSSGVGTSSSAPDSPGAGTSSSGPDPSSVGTWSAGLAPPGAGMSSPGPAPSGAGTGPSDPASSGTGTGPSDLASSGAGTSSSGSDPGTPAAGSDAPGAGAPDSGPQGAESPSTESSAARAAVLAAAQRITGDKIVQANGGRYVRRVGPTPGQPLPLVLSVPRDPPVVRYGPLAVVVVLAGVFAVLAAGRLARSTTRPLAELARAADRVAEGDLATRVPVRFPDEVGRLADSFNRMTREAESYLRALVISRHQLREQLAVLGDTLASTHDLHRIFQVLLRAAMAATGARAGVVLLLDPRTGVLVGECAEGLDRRGVGVAPRPPGNDDGDRTREPDGGGTGELDGRRDGPTDGRPRTELVDGLPGRATAGRPRQGEPPALRIPLGKGLLGVVAAAGEPRRGRLDRDGPRLYGREPRCRTYVAVPLPAADTGAQVPFPLPEPASTGTPSTGTASTGTASTGTPSLRPATASGWPAGTPGTGTARPGRTLGAGRTPIGGRATVGVLALYDRLGSDEFDDADLVTLGTFADHAAVAVANVRMHEEAQRLSLTDPLTGLWNYRYLTESIRREIERASRFGRMLSVLALDLDRFKQVNDTYGHAAGDAVLAEFARRIRGAMREVDLAFRQGGEEFVVLLPETDARGAATVAERLGAAVRETPIAIRPRSGAIAPVRGLVSVTVSIGVAVYPDHAATGPQLLVAADEALYAAKAAGRDTYQLATVAGRLTVEEIPVRAGAATPDDGLPWAGGRPTLGGAGGRSTRTGRPGAEGATRPGRPGGEGPTRTGRAGVDGPVAADGGPDGALSGPQPPRQGRGR
ncbi:diguanylate cyclase [Plantactinospora endophytica]|uniref:diguanylate cyclase n=1 Tax=Plantactinospora endophytica TaxID=673535 RepID=UPI0036707EE8